MPKLNSAAPFSRAEQDLLTSWADPPAWDPATGRETEPPGRGRFLIKVGGRPGIPVKVELTPAEASVNDTNKRWHTPSPVGTDPAGLDTDTRPTPRVEARSPRTPAPRAPGARSGGATRKASTASKPSGAPGNTCAWTPPPAPRSGCATTPTHMTVLLSPDGPFKGCTRDTGHRARTKPLPADPPPAGLFA